tara:strand:+ start:230 stop:751 length:522 start_codon:yes stop_codon:yes gene_type:complete
MIRSLVGELFVHKKIEVRKSILQGYGVFATDFIKSGELLEQCHWIQIPNRPCSICQTKLGRGDISLQFQLIYGFSFPRRYDYNYQKTDWAGALPLGFGCIYNSRDDTNEQNADWKTDIKTNLFEFFTIKDIQKDEEILTDYQISMENNRDKITGEEPFYNDNLSYRTKPKVSK